MLKLVFFSGGSALAPLSRFMAKTNFPSSHLITTFDNGGSSAELRKAFAMPAVGDLRNRLIALASPDNPSQFIKFLSFRLPKDISYNGRQILENMISPANPVWQVIPDDKAFLIRNELRVFLEQAPETFNYNNASIGNLIITGLYFKNHRDLNAAIKTFSNIVSAKGEVIPVCDSNLQLVAILQNRKRIFGQENLKLIASPVENIFLTVHDSENNFNMDKEKIECSPFLSQRAQNALENASIICYPPGSFYSSILVNLLLKGVPESVAKSSAVKIFIPNSGFDPEERNLGYCQQALHLLKILQKNNSGIPPEKLLDFILIDSRNGKYAKEDRQYMRQIENLGVKILDKPIVSPENSAFHIPAQTLEAILSTVQ